MNELFLERMKTLLQNEYPAYVKTLEEERFRGIRINTLKGEVTTLLDKLPFSLQPTPFCEEAFFLKNEEKQVGNSFWHMAGAFYMQEPSAMSAVEILDVQKGDWVLDLCAAPGGKSTQIAAKLQNTGFLLSNEIEGKRAQILLSNLERIGASVNMITNAHPKDLCSTCAGWFDKVLVDAPCSGEGMFKKHSAAMEDWSEAHVEACGKRQIQILQSAYQALKENGILVYSTCTYAPEENEMVVANLLKLFPDLKQLDCGVSFGRSGVAQEGMDETKVRRIFPMDQGEGHFVAKFQKMGPAEMAKQKEQKPVSLDKSIAKTIDQIVALPKGYIYLKDTKVYYKPTPFLHMGNIKVLREGVLCGEIIKNRLEPHQHLFMSAYLRDHLLQYCELNETQCNLYMEGEQLAIPGYHGYVACGREGLVLGFGKGDGQVIKNKYPKGLRQR